MNGKLALPLVCILAAVSALGCASIVTSRNGGAVLQPEGGSEGIPIWVDRFPADPEYYVGIGSSNTGDKSWDMEEARKRALSNLAASITIEISSNQTSVAQEDSVSKGHRSAQIIISEQVNQNLEQVEIVDSYYSHNDGYWFFMRLNKKAWKEIDSREIVQLEERVKSLIDPVIDDTKSSILKRLSTLWEGRELVTKSPYSGTIESEIGGYQGILIDLIEGQIATLIESLSISVDPSHIKIDLGDPVEISIEVDTTEPLEVGSFPLIFTRKETGNIGIASVNIGLDGRFTGAINLYGLPPGTIPLSVRLDFSSMGIDLSESRKLTMAPVFDLFVTVNQLMAGLVIIEPPKSMLENTFALFESLLSERLAFTFASPELYDERLIRVNVQLHCPPQSESLYFCYQQVFITLEIEGRNIYTFQSPEVKGGGIRLEQAQNRALSKLIDLLQEDEKLVHDLSRSISQNR